MKRIASRSPDAADGSLLEAPTASGLARRSLSFWCSVPLLIEAYARLGYREQVLSLAPYAQELQSRGVFQAGGWTGPVPVVKAIISTMQEHWDDAESGFRSAIEEIDAAPNHLQTGPVREWYAEMLFARDRSGDRDRGLEVLDEAIRIYETLGFKGLENHARKRRQASI